MRLRTLGILGGVFLAAALVLGTVGTALAQQAGPYGSGWGPGGMMGGWGGGYGGVMGGWGGGPGGMMGGWGWNSGSSGNNISMDQAKQAVENYISSTGDPNLQIDEVMEFQNNFYAIIKEKHHAHPQGRQDHGHALGERLQRGGLVPQLARRLHPDGERGVSASFHK